MVTLAAITSTQPRMSLPSITAPAWRTSMSPLTTVSFVPAGTPVLLASGNPQPTGWGAQLGWCGLAPAGGVADGPWLAERDGEADGEAVDAAAEGSGAVAEVGVGTPPDREPRCRAPGRSSRTTATPTPTTRTRASPPISQARRVRKRDGAPCCRRSGSGCSGGRFIAATCLSFGESAAGHRARPRWCAGLRGGKEESIVGLCMWLNWDVERHAPGRMVRCDPIKSFTCPGDWFTDRSNATGWDVQLTTTGGKSVQSVVSATRHFLSDLLYERRYRVNTSQKLNLDSHDAENICYAPVGWRQLRRALPPRLLTGEDVFVDLGSGMGRAVLEAAATYPVARVIGVELVS